MVFHCEKFLQLKKNKGEGLIKKILFQITAKMNKYCDFLKKDDLFFNKWAWKKDKHLDVKNKAAISWEKRHRMISLFPPFSYMCQFSRASAICSYLSFFYLSLFVICYLNWFKKEETLVHGCGFSISSNAPRTSRANNEFYKFKAQIESEDRRTCRSPFNHFRFYVSKKDSIKNKMICDVQKSKFCKVNHPLLNHYYHLWSEQSCEMPSR